MKFIEIKYTILGFKSVAVLYGIIVGVIGLMVVNYFITHISLYLLAAFITGGITALVSSLTTAMWRDFENDRERYMDNKFIKIDEDTLHKMDGYLSEVLLLRVLSSASITVSLLSLLPPINSIFVCISGAIFAALLIFIEIQVMKDLRLAYKKFKINI